MTHQSIWLSNALVPELKELQKMREDACLAIYLKIGFHDATGTGLCNHIPFHCEWYLKSKLLAENAGENGVSVIWSTSGTSKTYLDDVSKR